MNCHVISFFCLKGFCFMLYLVTGGSGSGKSAYAEDLAVQLKNQTRDGSLYYMATMHCYDEESRNRIKRHQDMRKDKGFQTIEQELFLGKNEMGDGFFQKSFLQRGCKNNGTFLLEDLSNLLANEMYIGKRKELFYEGNQMEGGKASGERQLLDTIKAIVNHGKHLVIVTNEIFSDGMIYDKDTENFMRQLAFLNCEIGKVADGVIEVVCGIPIWQKGTPL